VAAKPAISRYLDMWSSAPNRKPYFDPELGVWILSSYEDVVSALKHPSLHPVGPRGKLKSQSEHDEASARMRSETAAALSPRQIEAWQTNIDGSASLLAKRLRTDEPVDLVSEYLSPLCQDAALLVTKPCTADLSRLRSLAAIVSKAAANPFDTEIAAQAKTASFELQTYFDSGPTTLRESGFVALSETMVHLLARCVLVLATQSSKWKQLHERPATVENAVEELLRHTGLTRMIFRIASADVEVNGAFIQKGERSLLEIDTANRDPRAFDHAEILDLDRNTEGHLALGYGKHACAGAPLIRMLIRSALKALTDTFGCAALVCEPEWMEGAGFSFPKTVLVKLTG
jgi:cytochrome P450